MGLGDKIMRALTGDDWNREDEAFRDEFGVHTDPAYL